MEQALQQGGLWLVQNVPWWGWILFYAVNSGFWFGLFRDVDTGLISMSRFGLLFGPLITVALIGTIGLCFIWLIVKLAFMGPVWLGQWIRDRLFDDSQRYYDYEDM